MSDSNNSGSDGTDSDSSGSDSTDLTDIERRTTAALSHRANEIDPDQSSRQAIADRLAAANSDTNASTPTAAHRWRRSAGAVIAAAAALLLVIGITQSGIFDRDTVPNDVVGAEPDGLESSPTTAATTATTATSEANADETPAIAPLEPTNMPGRFIGVTTAGQLVEVDSTTGEVLVDRGALDDPRTPIGETNETNQFINRASVGPTGDIWVNECCEPADGRIRQLDESVPTVTHPDYAASVLRDRTSQTLTFMPAPATPNAWALATGYGGLQLLDASSIVGSPGITLSSSQAVNQSGAVWISERRAAWAPALGPDVEGAALVELVDFDADGTLSQPPTMVDLSTTVPNGVHSMALGPAAGSILISSCSERSEDVTCVASSGHSLTGLTDGDATAESLDLPNGFLFGATSWDTQWAIGVDATRTAWAIGPDGLVQIGDDFRWATWIPDGVDTPLLQG